MEPEQGERGLRGRQGNQGNRGPEGPSVNTDQLMTAIKWAAGFGVAGLLAVGLALGIFVFNAQAERDEICDIIRDVSLGNAQALVVATEPEEQQTSEQERRRTEVVERYLEGIRDNLGKCR